MFFSRDEKSPSTRTFCFLMISYCSGRFDLQARKYADFLDPVRRLTRSKGNAPVGPTGHAPAWPVTGLGCLLAPLLCLWKLLAPLLHGKGSPLAYPGQPSRPANHQADVNFSTSASPARPPRPSGQPSRPPNHQAGARTPE